MMRKVPRLGSDQGRRGDPKAAADGERRGESRGSRKCRGGGAGQPQITPELVRVLDAAQQTSTRAGDEYVAQDRLLVALAESDTPAGRALEERPA